MEKRISELEAKLTEKDEAIDNLEKRLAFYENPHTPSSKQQSPPESSDDESDDDEEDNDEDARTDGGTIGRNPGHDPAFRTPPKPDETIELTQYNRHHYTCESCGEETVASDPSCPDDGQFGVNVLAETALNRYEYRLPYRKIAERFDHLYDLSMSGASAWHATERAARAGRAEYDQIQAQLRQADIVHIYETGMKLDGEQAVSGRSGPILRKVYNLGEDDIDVIDKFLDVW